MLEPYMHVQYIDQRGISNVRILPYYYLSSILYTLISVYNVAVAGTTCSTVCE